MTEIITINIGQCGTQIAQSFLELACLEEGISPDGTLKEDPKSSKETSSKRDNTRHKILFDERPDGRFTPRSVMIDLNTDQLAKI